MEVVRFTDAARGTYKKAVIRDGRLIGAILLGETSAAGTLTRLYDHAGPLPAERLGLLFPGVGGAAEAESPLRMPDAATVCQCNNVSKGRSAPAGGTPAPPTASPARPAPAPAAAAAATPSRASSPGWTARTPPTSPEPCRPVGRGGG